MELKEERKTTIPIIDHNVKIDTCSKEDIKEQLKQNCVDIFSELYGYDIVEATNFETEEQEDGIINCMLETICGYEEDTEDDLPEEEDSKIFWFDLIPNNGTYRMKNIHIA